MATGQPDNSGAIHWIAGGVAILASALLAILAAGDHDRVEYKVSNLPENDPTMLGDELVVRRVTENGYIFDDNIGCTRPTGSAYLQDGRDGQTSVPRLSRTTPAEVRALGQGAVPRGARSTDASTRGSRHYLRSKTKRIRPL